MAVNKGTLIVGPTLAFFALYGVVLAASVFLFAIPCSDAFTALGESARKLQGVLLISPVIGFAVGHWLSGAVMMAATGGPLPGRQPAYFWFTLGCIIAVTILCYGGAAHLLIGKQGVSIWESTIGLWRFRIIYHLAAPVIGYFGSLAVAAVLSPKGPFTV